MTSLRIELPFPPACLNPNRKNGKWTAPELAHLRGNWKATSHAEMASALGRTVRAVRNKCWELGLVDKSNEWSEQDVARLREAYSRTSIAKEINLTGIAMELGRHKTNVCRKARALGLTDQKRAMVRPEDRRVRLPMFTSKDELSKNISERVKRRLAEHGHPRGALGMKHSQATKDLLALRSREYNASLTPQRKAEIALKMMKTRAANGTYVPERPNATWKAGWREIGGARKYYRSKWEANYAWYLQWLKEKGQIADWKHEPKTFWFDGVKRGTNSYLPDFWVQEISGAEAYHEVKGWMDDRSKTKIKRMAKYHPKVKLIVIDSKAYVALKKSVMGLVPGWEI